MKFRVGGGRGGGGWSYVSARIHVKDGPQVFQKSRSKLKVLGFYGVTSKKFHSVDS
jgi:hypothetical protein